MVATTRGLRRIGDVDDRGAELVLVRDVPDIGVAARDAHLAGAGEIEMAEAADVAGERWLFGGSCR